MKALLAFALFSAVSTVSANAANVLFFGDSHSVATYGPFGQTMNKLLRTLPGARVTMRARCGSIIEWWYTGHEATCGYFDQDPDGPALPAQRPADSKHKTPWYPTHAPSPKILSLVETAKPNLIVVEMGGNYIYSDNLEFVKKDIATFIADIAKLKPKVDCVWIGHPSRRIPPPPKDIAFKKKVLDLTATIKETVEPTCEFFDSTQVTEYPAYGGDGTHYSFADGILIGNLWAEKAFEIVKTHYSKIKP